MLNRYRNLLIGLALAIGIGPPAASAADWQAVGGTALDSADVMSIAVKPGTDDVRIAATHDGTFWRWDATAGDWDSIGTAGFTLFRAAIIPDPFAPDSVFISYIRDDWNFKPARGGTVNGNLVETYLGSWSATSDTEWVSVGINYTGSVAVLSDGVSMLAAGENGIIYRSDDEGHSWYFDEGIPNYLGNEIRDLVVMADSGRDFLVVAGSNLYDPNGVKPARSAYGGGSYPVMVLDYLAGSPWIPGTDSLTWDTEGYDLMYEPAVGGVVLAAQNKSWIIGAQELTYSYDYHAANGGPMKWYSDDSDTSYYPRAYAVDGTDVVAVTTSGAVRAVNYGNGVVADISDGLPAALSPVLASGSTKLFLATRSVNGASGGVFMTDLTGGTPFTSISGHIEINGARPPAGTFVGAWVRWLETNPDVAAWTDENGDYVIDGLPEGDYTILFFGRESYPGGVYTGEPGIPTDFTSVPRKVHVDGANPVTGIDYVWDGVPEWGKFMGDDQTQAIPVAVGRTVEATINSPNWIDYDWYYVPLDSGQGVVIDVNPQPAGVFHPVIEFFEGDGLYTGNSTQVGSYGGDSPLASAHIGAVALDGRGLWFRIANFDTWAKPADGSFNHHYTVTVSPPPAMESEPANDDTTTATSLVAGSTVVGVVHDSVDVSDYYRIDVSDTSAVSLEVSFAGYFGSADISLLDATGVTYVGGQITTSGASAWRFDDVLPGGTYYLRIANPSGWMYYMVSRIGDQTEPNDDVSTATPIAYGESLAGMSLGSTNDVDYYSFAGMAGDIVAVTIDPRDVEGAHPMVELMDADETFYRRGIMQDQVNGLPEGQVRLIATLPHAGQYVLKVAPDWNWYNYSPMGGAGARYDMRIDRITEQVSGASDPLDLFVEPNADIFAVDVAEDADGNIHYVWSDMGGWADGGSPVAKRAQSTFPPGGAIFYAKFAPDGTALISPTPVAPVDLFYMSAPMKPAPAADRAKSARSAVQNNGGPRPSVAIDPQGNVRISWMSVSYYSNEVATINHVWFDPSLAPNDGSPLYDMNAPEEVWKDRIHFTVPVLDNLDEQPGSQFATWGEAAVRQLIGPGGAIYLIWDQEESIRMARLTPRGTLIGEPITIAGYRSGYNKAPDAAMDGNGNIHIAWANASRMIRYAMVGPDGSMLIPPVTVGGNHGWAWGPSLAVGPEGNVHIAWTEASDPGAELSIRSAEVYYTQLNPYLAPLDGSPVFPGVITAVAPHRVTPGNQWPSAHPNLIAGGDGLMYLSWHEWGHGSDSPGMTKPAAGINDEGPSVVGVHLARLSSTGMIVGDPVITGAKAAWNSWKMDPSPVVVGADGVAHAAWVTEYEDRYIPDNGWWTFNTIQTQSIPVGDIMGPYLELVGYHRFTRQLNRAAPGDTLTFVVHARDLDAPVNGASVYLKFDPAVLSPTGSDGNWTYLVGSPFLPVNVQQNVENGNMLSITAASDVGIPVADTLFAVRMVVRQDAPFLTQSPLTFVYDVEGNRRTLINETKPGLVGAVFTVGVLGDVSGDSHVAAFDASLILQHLVGLRAAGSVPGLVEAISDVSGRAGLTAFDASLILRYVLGTLDHFPVEGLDGVPRPAAGAGETYIAGFGVPRLDGERFVLPISVDHRTGIQAGLIRFRLPAEVGTVESVRTGSGGLVSFRRDGDHIVAAFADPTLDSKSAGDVLVVTIRAETGHLTEPISLTSVTFNEGDGAVQLDGAETSLAHGLPTAAELGHNAPNPFNPTTVIPYAVPYSAEHGLQAVRTSLAVYSITGQLVTTLVNDEIRPGRYTVTWNGSDAMGRSVGAGVYLVVLRAGNQMRAGRMVLLR